MNGAKPGEDCTDGTRPAEGRPDEAIGGTGPAKKGPEEANWAQEDVRGFLSMGDIDLGRVRAAQQEDPQS